MGLNFQAKIVSKNESNSNAKGSKWGPKSILEASKLAKPKEVQFLMPRGGLTDLFWQPIWKPNIVPNPSKICFQDARVFEQQSAPFGITFETDFEANFEDSVA